jgi:hypothetical protein
MPPTEAGTAMSYEISDTETRRRPDEDRAREWLKRQLEWEEILVSLRDSGDRSARRRPPGREAAAA